MNNAFAQYFAVGAYGIGWQYYNDGGTVKYGPVQPAFKDFLALMAAWYKEGLIDPDYVNTDQKLRDSKITTGQLCSWLGLTGGGIGYYKDLMKGKDPASFNLLGLPYPTLKKGDKLLFGHDGQRSSPEAWTLPSPPPASTPRRPCNCSTTPTATTGISCSTSASKASASTGPTACPCTPMLS